MKEAIKKEEPDHTLVREINDSQFEFIKMVILGIIGMLGWIFMFSLGLLVDSKPYRDIVVSHFNMQDFLMGVLTYTPTNIVILCITASFSGGCASRLVMAGITKKSNLDYKLDHDKNDSHLYMTENPFSSMLRGLVVYFAFLAGVFVATSNPFANPTAQQYTQSAGVVSLLSFIVGYDPTAFRSLINLAGKIKGSNSEK